MKTTWILAAAASVTLVAVAVALIPPALGGFTQRSGVLRSVWQNAEDEGIFCWNVTPRARLKGMRGLPAWRFVEVSSEYTEAVMRILRNDPDVAKLLQEGYNVTWIRPIITAVVSGTGDVELRATQALVLLRSSNATAQVLVDVSQGKVLKVTIVTRTVIVKS